MTSPFTDPVEAYNHALWKQQQVEEYSTYVAAQDIPVGLVLGFAKGQPIPKSTVEREGWEAAGLAVRIPPPDDPGLDRAEQLRARRARLKEESAAIDAELAAAEGYESRTIPQLREILADRGLPTSGNKTELLDRLHADDDKPADDEQSTESPEE